MNQGEMWRKIEGYEGDYFVSNLGKVKSFKQNKKGNILKQICDKDGYKYLTLCKNNTKTNFHKDTK